MITTPPSDGPSLLDLPVEVRLGIYSQLFDKAKVVLQSDNVAGITSMFPASAILATSCCCCSGQILRTCRTIAAEAQPILYARTTFHIMTNAFAPTLPRTLSDGHPSAPLVRHIIWALTCDMLKKFYANDFHFDQEEMGGIETLEIRCCAATWRDSFGGVRCDREAFVKDREEMMGYGTRLLACMQDGHPLPVTMTEDQQFLRRGEVRLKLERTRLSRARKG